MKKRYFICSWNVSFVHFPSKWNKCVSLVPEMIGSRGIPRIKTQYCVKRSDKGCSQHIYLVLFNSVLLGLCNLLTPHLSHAEHVFGNFYFSAHTWVLKRQRNPTLSAYGPDDHSSKPSVFQVSFAFLWGYCSRSSDSHVQTWGIPGCDYSPAGLARQRDPYRIQVCTEQWITSGRKTGPQKTCKSTPCGQHPNVGWRPGGTEMGLEAFHTQLSGLD